MHVTALYRYPVKSLQGAAVDSAQVEPIGLAGDRRWMVIDAAGRFVTRRERPQMALVHAAPAEGGLLLRHGDDALHVSFPDAEASAPEVTIWRDHVPARLGSAEAGAMLSAAIGVDVRLVYLDDPAARPVDLAYGDAGDRVSFADGFPVLLTSEESLSDLNARLDEPVSMRRFRPNIVISGMAPWDEDMLRRVRIGETVFRVVKPCSRCVMVTQDPDSGEIRNGNEPLTTLRKMGRMAKGGVMFGQNLVPDRLGTIRVGDDVEPLETGPSNLVRTGGAGALHSSSRHPDPSTSSG